MSAFQTWLNCFQYCKFLRFLGHVMVLIVLALAGLAYGTVGLVYFTKLIWGRSILMKLASVVVLVVYTILAVMCLWSYFATVSTDPGRVPPAWHPFADEQQARAELERMSYSNYYFDRRDPRRCRYCKRCQGWKPERAHHCSVSGRCVLKLDHYCLWVVNCVGLLNYKAFLLFLFYAALGSLVALLVLIKPMIDFFNMRLKGPAAPLVFITEITSGAFVLSLGGFLLMHGQLIASNCTTIEMYEKDRIHPWPYNKGFRRNFEEIFGRNKLRWFLPYYTKDEKRALLESVLSPRLINSPFLSMSSVA